MRFTTRILATGGQTTGIVVPADVLEALGGTRRPPVTVSIGGHTYRTTVASMGGQAMVALSKANRLAAGVSAGDEVEVDLEIDAAPREVEVPADLAAALDAEPGARQFFDGLAPSHKKRHVSVIEEAKTPETRQRRIAKAVEMLREGRR